MAPGSGVVVLVALYNSVMAARQTATPRLLREAALIAQDRIQDEFDCMVAALPDDARLRDDLERAIDEVDEPGAQMELRRLLKQLDEHRLRVGWALSLSVGPSLDVVRSLATDIESGQLQ